MNRLEAKKFLDILHPNSELFEIRSMTGKFINSGYFTNIDLAIEEMEKFPRTTFYVTLNKINTACYGREQYDKIIAINDKQKKTTADNDIIEINNILIDFDAKRASGVSASNEEKEFTRIKMRSAYRYLRDNGFEDMLVVDSGNGYHLIVRVAMVVKDYEIVKSFLLAMSVMFSDEHVDIDTTVYNPSRITKMAGVMTSKGANTGERPHRESKIIYAPDEIKPTSTNIIQKIASFVQQEVEAPSYRNNYQAFDLAAFIHKYGIQIHHEQTTNGITKYVLEECPFDCNHKAPDAALFRMSNGSLAFKCFHNSCSGKGWKDLRLKYEPTAYDNRTYSYVNSNASPNYKQPDYNPRVQFETKPENEPIFWTPMAILKSPKKVKEYLPTGIVSYDKKSRGLPKKGITCISGLRGSGKSSLLTNLTNNWMDAGYNVSVFSGELTKEDELDWRTLQAAGKQYCKATQFENFFVIDDGIKEKIAEWLEGHFFLYNNAYGNKFGFILEQMKRCVEEHKVDAIVLDNLSALDVSGLNPDKFEQQKNFVVSLKAFAEATNTQIIYCIHPRKAAGFLRLDDVAGVSTLTDLADDAWIIHRVNNDFKRLSKATLGLYDSNPIYESSNVIEVAKNRSGGMQDELIPLYFQKESKRMMNNLYENKVYGWQRNDALDELPM